MPWPLLYSGSAVACWAIARCHPAHRRGRAHVELQPHSTLAKAAVGVQGRAQEAQQMLEAVVAQDPSYAEAWNNLGVLQRDLGLIPVRPLAPRLEQRCMAAVLPRHSC